MADGDVVPAGDERTDEDDHDLLTFSEGGVRLREEIEFTRAELAAAGPQRRDGLQRRLDALTDALARNTRQADALPGETGFLAYRPPQRHAPDGS